VVEIISDGSNWHVIFKEAVSLGTHLHTTTGKALILGF